MLKVYSGTTEPETTTVSFGPGQRRANNALPSLVGGVVRVHALLVGGGTTDVIIDVNGYMEQVPN